MNCNQCGKQIIGRTTTGNRKRYCNRACFKQHRWEAYLKKVGKK